MKIRKSVAAAMAVAATLLFAAPTPAHAYVASGGWEDANVPQIIQDTNWNCVPAAFSMQLSSVGATYDQDTLATQMQTSQANGGTSWATAEPALNKIANPNWGYTVRPMENGTELENEVHYEISRFGSALVLPVWETSLPWHTSTSNYGHDIVAYGVNTGSGVVAVMDPNDDGTGGIHVVGAQTLWGALQSADTSKLNPSNVGTLHVVDEFSEDL